VAVGVSVGKFTPAATVKVAIWAGDSAPTGDGVQVGSGGNGVALGVGVGSPTNIWPNEQPRLVASSRIIRAARRSRPALLEAWGMGGVSGKRSGKRPRPARRREIGVFLARV
jgi:hypothetical protein